MRRPCDVCCSPTEREQSMVYGASFLNGRRADLEPADLTDPIGRPYWVCPTCISSLRPLLTAWLRCAKEGRGEAVVQALRAAGLAEGGSDG